MRIQWSLLALLVFVPSTHAQNNNNNNNGNAGGIAIDARGVVETTVTRKESPAAARKRQSEFVRNQLQPGIVVTTPRRVLSLKELEKQVAAALEAGNSIPISLQGMCGINRLDEVILDFDAADVLIAGPAEGFAPDSEGRLVGVESGRPTMLLDDLVIGLRTAYARDPTMGCSIDPTDDNMARLQDYLRQNSTVTSTAGAAQRYRVMAQVLGPQNIRLWGAPRDTHAAMVLVEADLRMKRISLGVEQSGVKGIRSQLSLLKPQGNSLQRWWFVPKYNPIQANAKRDLFTISGPRVKLLAQEEYSNASGQRFDAAVTRDSTEEFAKLFTEHYAKLAEVRPVFADLQNVFDLAVLGALIKQEGLDVQADWPMATFLNDPALPLAHYANPQYVSSMSTSRLAGNVMLGLVGGVTLDPRPTVQVQVDNNLPTPPEVSRESQSLFWDFAQ